MAKNFVLAAQEADRADEETIEFTINGGEPFYAYAPTESQIALFSTAMSAIASEADQIASVMELFQNMLDKEDFRRFRGLLADRYSGFTPHQLMEILDYLIGEFSARPTPPSSVSTSSPQRAGTRSTANSPARGSTRSRSPRAASAT